MNDLKQLDGWVKLGKWLLNHGFVALLLIILYFWFSANGWLDPSIRFATAQEVIVVQDQITEQKQNYSKINKGLLEIRIGQKQVLLRDMERERDGRIASGHPVPNWLEDQINESRKRIVELQQEAGK